MALCQWLHGTVPVGTWHCITGYMALISVSGYMALITVSGHMALYQ